jgi:acyl carrier protein
VGVDHVVLTHKNSNQIMKESLKIASTICRGCFHASSSLALEYAYKHNIRVVVGATLSRGQIIENKLDLFLKQGITEVNRLEHEVSRFQKNAPVVDKNIFDHIGIDAVIKGEAQEYVTIVDFYRYVNITNKAMIEYLNDRNPYWKTRKNYAIYSTNCPIKQIGDYAHLQERGYHYYGGATYWEKRQGHLDLEKVKEDLTCSVPTKSYNNFSKRIGYQPKVSIENGEYICAYIVTGEEVPDLVFREYLADKIPDYMIPSHFVQIKSIPLTPTGKIDRKALPVPSRSRSRLGSTYVAPKTDIEKMIATVWTEVLKVDMAGVEDNFFDLGGDSLDIIMVGSKLKEVLKRDISTVTLFASPTIQSLAQQLKHEEDQESVITEEIDRSQTIDEGKNLMRRSMRKLGG